MRYHLAIDIGASSGRCTIGYLKEGKLQLEEIHRFANGIEKKEGHFVWNLAHIREEIRKGLIFCREKGRIPESLGIDTWGVDYVLLDEKDEAIGEAIAYRDRRTMNMDMETEKIIDRETLYKRTGIQKQPFNTIYQLMDEKLHTGRLEKAEALLMIPDYLNFVLTGKKVQEYTNASTTQLLHHEDMDWDFALIEELGFPKKIFQEIVMPGYNLGSLKEDIIRDIGYTCQVIVPATHDTASAVMSIPSLEKQPMYLSSGTWSLLGTILPEKVSTRESMVCNFTNEGAYDGSVRYLKNIMGLWMVQRLHKEYEGEISFDELMEQAEKASVAGIINCNSPCFMNPESMFQAISDEACNRRIRIPENIFEAVKLSYISLAEAYKEAVIELEAITGLKSDTLYIVGGGAQAGYLNRLTADATGKRVVAGPVEATSIGNLLVQLETTGQLDRNESSRMSVLKDLIIGTFKPGDIKE